VILLNSCAAIWAAANDPSLKASTTSLIDDAARDDMLALSSITAWEIGTLIRRGRLRVQGSGETFLSCIFEAPGVRELPVNRKIATHAAMLGDDFHGDPANRIIIATAIVRRCRLITRDRLILAYAKKNRKLDVAVC
jgi:PIN domain nuclease of toxin-antitoxin system